MSITLIIIIITGIVSFTAFTNDKVYNDLIFYPPAVTYDKQWYRFFSCGLIHADWMHLIFNMWALYLFGTALEQAFISVFAQMGKIFYLLLYISSLFFCLIPTYARHKNDSSYRSLGASGAVSAVIFACILYLPLMKLRFFFIPIDIRGFIFGAAYLIISSYLDKRGGDRVNHSAHIWGALYGIVFFIVMAYAFSNYPVLEMFIGQIKSWLNEF
ncbi:MAG: rhomboid family intramembrane serine protease [Pseudobacter sp.]|uniref:rhomboid family intramembrane serine protease n=1 Tax=Pseudobacter sp. TaxID=2045420 RepID=UPI003F7D7C3B